MLEKPSAGVSQIVLMNEVFLQFHYRPCASQGLQCAEKPVSTREGAYRGIKITSVTIISSITISKTTIIIPITFITLVLLAFLLRFDWLP